MAEAGVPVRAADVMAVRRLALMQHELPRGAEHAHVGQRVPGEAAAVVERDAVEVVHEAAGARRVDDHGREHARSSLSLSSCRWADGRARSSSRRERPMRRMPSRSGSARYGVPTGSPAETRSQ